MFPSSPSPSGSAASSSNPVGVVGAPSPSNPGSFRSVPLGPPSSLNPPLYTEQEEKNRLKFQVRFYEKDHFVQQSQHFLHQIELEFVQCLGNPNYLHFLAQRGYFKEANFINYLRYLMYWKDPQYVKYIKFPVCLHYLELLQHESFRKEIVNGQVRVGGFIM